jgi:hypothetical protein
MCHITMGIDLPASELSFAALLAAAVVGRGCPAKPAQLILYTIIFFRKLLAVNKTFRAEHLLHWSDLRRKRIST